MSKQLVIVESPAKAKTINTYLGRDYIVKASMGHVRDLPEKSLGVAVDNRFEPEYQVMKGKAALVKELRTLAKQADSILLSTDPDREGEAIAFHLESLLKSANPRIRRVTFHEINKKAILQAIQAPRPVDQQLVDSQQARRVLDRLVGYKLSPFLGRKIKHGLSAGRVQSVALLLVVQRAEEIENFKLEEYWEIKAHLQTDAKAPLFPSQLVTIDGKKAKIGHGEMAAAVVAEAKEQTFRVRDIKRAEKKRSAAPPFTTSTLQQEAARKLRYDVAKTMRVAQQLYEGVTINGQPVGLITYMRTDSTRVAPDIQQAALRMIEEQFGKSYRPSRPNFYRSKGGAQDAHEAIRPTYLELAPARIKSQLSADQFKLYKLIYERFMASQMSPAVYDTMTVAIEAGRLGFQSTGRALKFDGFLKVYEEGRDAKKAGEVERDEGDALLPPMEVGQRLLCGKIDPSQHFTKPPAWFSEASLVKELEKRGIGRPSTYASIISVLKARGYVVVESHQFHPTDVGRAVCHTLVEHFPDLINVEFTAEMEKQLDQVADGDRDWRELMRSFYEPFAVTLEQAMKNADRVQVGEETDRPCPACGQKLWRRDTKYGPVYACGGYPKCKFIVPVGEPTNTACPSCQTSLHLCEVTPKGKRKAVKQYHCYQCRGKFGYGRGGKPESLVTETEHRCEKCEQPMLKRKGPYGYFLACSGYPKCKHIMKIDKEGNPVSAEPKNVQVTNQCCPKCGSVMILREKGEEKFLGCSRFPRCRSIGKWSPDVQVIDELPFAEVKKRYKQVKKRKK
ncbi:MAG TPA: type I DNA topoisomerase [Bacilli bacterium]|nr:type I DNA topoisomerase [Bacilli bacterium]